MPGNAPMSTDERDLLLGYLSQQRDGLRFVGFGLTEEQIRLRPTRSALSVGGLIKHAAVTERSWVQVMAQAPDQGDEDEYRDSFAVADDETLAGLLGELDQVGQETAAAVAGLDSLEVRVPLPPAPWFPENPDGFSARWILLHVLEELARHAGHADILREQIDGATMYALMAGAEGWPETDWLKPWRPPSAEVRAARV